MTKRFRLDTGCIIDQQENKVLSDREVRNLLNRLHEDREALIEFIKKEFPKSSKHILEGFE